MDYPDVWLEQIYGSSEAIEIANLRDFKPFQKITNEDHHKLQKLSDLLMELELAKADPHLPGLSYFNTSHDVDPVVLKVPYSLQEKWTAQGSNYKGDNNVSLPPF